MTLCTWHNNDHTFATSYTVLPDYFNGRGIQKSREHVMNSFITQIVFVQPAKSRFSTFTLNKMCYIHQVKMNKRVTDCLVFVRVWTITYILRSMLMLIYMKYKVYWRFINRPKRNELHTVVYHSLIRQHIHKIEYPSRVSCKILSWGEQQPVLAPPAKMTGFVLPPQINFK